MEGKGSNFVGNSTIICQDKLFELTTPKVMGVLNCTPDSFFEGSRTKELESAIARAEAMVNEGVDIIDVGGISTRSNADLLDEEEELKRVIPVIEVLHKKFPEILLSIDTFRANVAQEAVSSGVHIVNDVYGGRYDPQMIPTVAKLKVPFIVMHSRGDASNMQSLTAYEDVVEDVLWELSVQVAKLRKAGVNDVIVDPGFGFAKTIEQNYQLIKALPFLKLLDCPLLIGISRKSMLYKLLNSSPKDVLNGTTVLNTIAIFGGAKIIRVHDVKEAKEIITIKNRFDN